MGTLMFALLTAAGFAVVVVALVFGWLSWLARTAPEWPTDRCVECGHPRQASKTPGQCTSCRDRAAAYDATWARITGRHL